jgi:hypothetical protein
MSSPEDLDLLEELGLSDFLDISIRYLDEEQYRIICFLLAFIGNCLVILDTTLDEFSEQSQDIIIAAIRRVSKVRCVVVTSTGDIADKFIQLQSDV